MTIALHRPPRTPIVMPIHISPTRRYAVYVMANTFAIYNRSGKRTVTLDRNRFVEVNEDHALATAKAIADFLDQRSPE